jgi:hypothetical protein
LLAKKNTIMIAGVIAVVIVFAYVSSNNPIDLVTRQESLDNIEESKVQGPSLASQGNDISGTYRINTECQLIYGISHGLYPDGEKLPEIKIDNLIASYPEEFKAWSEILQNPDDRVEFFKKPLSDEFRVVLTTALMKESSINPKLEQTALIVTDAQGTEKLQQVFQEFECQKYFDERQKK